MRRIFASVFLVFLIFRSEAQSDAASAVQLFNDFQDYLSTKPDQDSALYAAVKLANIPIGTKLLTELLHNSFAQEFIQSSPKPERILFVSQLLKRMATDTTVRLKRTVSPIYLFTRVQAAKDDKVLLRELTNEFMAYELTPEKFYNNRSARYGLMIYDIISKQKELQVLSGKLLEAIFSTLKNNQIEVSDSLTRTVREKRAWYRWLFAYVNYVKAEKTTDLKKREEFLRAAFDFSPDLSDKNYPAVFHYEVLFVSGENDISFPDAYLDFIIKNKVDRKKVLSILESMALTDPAYKSRLKDYYGGLSPKLPFDDYWMDAVNANAKPAQPFSLTGPDGNAFASRSTSGKWMLIDFWGTWCVPCREEHPELQKFYDSTVLIHQNRITLMTVACKDTREKVQAYMKEKGFNFPVAMADNYIENNYRVTGYPTKVLVTPAGRYVSVPFGVDWVEFVKRYCGLEEAL